MDPTKALEAKERGNDHFRAGQWPKAIDEYEEVSPNYFNFHALELYHGLSQRMTS